MPNRQNKTILRTLPADLAGEQSSCLETLLLERDQKPAHLILNAANVVRIDQMALALLDDLAAQQRQQQLDFNIINVSATLRFHLARTRLTDPVLRAVA